MQITAEKREKFGKSTKSLRNERRLPAVIFGKNYSSIPLTIDYNNFVKVYDEAGETSLIDLTYNGDNEKVLVKEVQVHPVSGQFLHVGFYKVDLSQKINASIPVEIVGEEKSPVLKSGEGILLTLLNEIEVECFPSDLPSEFEIDVSNLTEIGDGITVGELSFDREKVELVGELEDDELIVKIDYAQMAEEEEEEIDEAAALEGIEATEEGERVEKDGDGDSEGSDGAESAKAEEA